MNPVKWKDGFFAFFRGMAFIYRHSLWKYVILPGLVSLLAGALIFTASLYGAEYLGHYLWEHYLAEFISNETLVVILDWSGYFLQLVTAIVLTLVLFRPVLSLVIIPFLGPLLEQVEQIHTGERRTTTLAQDFRNALIGAGTGFKHSAAGIVILLVSYLVGPFSALVNAAAQSYFLGRGSFDLLFEKESASVRERKQLAKQHRMEIFGLGGAFFLALFVPILGILLAPAFAVTGAALVYYPPKDR